MTLEEAIALRRRALNELVASAGRAIEEASQLALEAVRSGHTIFFMGNGGSAADAQHLAAELVGRFVKERAGLPAMALTGDIAAVTAIANDYGFPAVFERQVQALVHAGDVVVGLSTSGRSANVLAGLKAARQRSATTVGFTGRRGDEMRDVCDVVVQIPSDHTAVIQECHQLIGHYICQVIDDATGPTDPRTLS